MRSINNSIFSNNDLNDNIADLSNLVIVLGGHGSEGKKKNYLNN